MEKKSILFKGYMIEKFILEKIENIPEEKQQKLSIKCDSFESTLKKKEDSYCVSISLLMYTNTSKLSLAFNGFFEIPDDFEEENKDYFLRVSAPAILYPYVRTFISNVTSFDIDGTILLPIINFANIPEE